MSGGFVWQRETTTFETGGNDSIDSSGSFEEDVDLTEDDGDADNEENPPEKHESDADFKITDRDKVTDDLWRVTVSADANSSSVAVLHRVDVTEVKQSVNDSSSRRATTSTLDEDYWKAKALANGDTIKQTKYTDETTTRTFTTEGSDPEDKQTLDITRTFDVEDTARTDYAVLQHPTAAHGIPVEIDGSGVVLVADHSTTTTVIDEDTTYHASHRLGPDGVSAVKGTLVADHSRIFAVTTDQSGSEDVEGQTRTTRTHETANKVIVKQHEESGYEDTGKGRSITGEANTTVRNIGREKFIASLTGERVVGDWTFGDNDQINRLYLHVTTTTTDDVFGDDSSQVVATSETTRESVGFRDYDSELHSSWSGDSNWISETQVYTSLIKVTPEAHDNVDRATYRRVGKGDHIATYFDGYHDDDNDGYNDGVPTQSAPLGKLQDDDGWDSVDVHYPPEHQANEQYADRWDARAHYGGEAPEAKTQVVSENHESPNRRSITAEIRNPNTSEVAAIPSQPRNSYPWDRPQGPGGIYHVNGSGNLVRALLGEYIVPAKSIGEWFTQHDTTYTRYITDAFDYVPTFQQNVVAGQRAVIQQEVRNRLRDHIQNPHYAGSFSFRLENRNIQRSDKFPVALGVDDTLSFALGSPIELNANHEVRVYIKDGKWNYDVASSYEWHDEFDWNSYSQLYPQQESGWGVFWTAIEGTLDLALDKIADLNFYFTLYYGDGFSKELPGQDK